MKRAKKAQLSAPPPVTAGLLQRKDSAREPVPQVVHEVLSSTGEPLEETTRTAMESHFGHDFSNVRVHTDTRAGESADAVNAYAYTVGRNVVFGNGKYSPATTSGRQLIAHELTHVVQQSRSEASAGLQRQPKPATTAKTPPKAPAKGTDETPPKKTYPVENCPFPSDFKDENEAKLNMMCANSESKEKAPECNFTDKHLQLLNEAKETARKKVEKAERRMHWFGGPEYAERVSRYIFDGTPPDVKTIKETLAKMVKILSGTGIRFRGATCADPVCESFGHHALGFETGRTDPVGFCPRSFLPGTLPELVRTIIHEGVHLAGIDIDPDVEERYCENKGCQAKCADATVAEAWTLFIDCLGGPYIKPKEPEKGTDTASSGPAKGGPTKDQK